MTNQGTVFQRKILEMHQASLGHFFCCTSFNFVFFFSSFFTKFFAVSIAFHAMLERVTSTRGRHAITFFSRTSRVNVRFVTMLTNWISFHSTFSEWSHFLASHSGPSRSFQKRFQRNDVRRKVVSQNDSSFSITIQFIYEAKPVNYHTWAKPGK